MLNCIEDDISRLGHVLTVLRLDADIENLLLVRETKEYKEVIKRKSELEDFAGALDVVKQAIQSVLDANARKKLATVKRTISDTFDSLANRPEYSELEIDPDSFEIVAGKGGTKIPALSVLNEGDLNCAGLSVFLGLATTQDLCHNLGFVILDEPSQTLDPSHKENLIKVLNGLPEEKQLLISTSQPDLSELVIKQTPRKKRHYRFAQRSASRGVQLL
jgi:DNA repair exonuclease SbcCD ATPase subunit